MAHEKRVTLSFINYFIVSFKAILEVNAPATAQKNINVEILENIEIPLPPIPIQHQIVSIIEELFSELDAGVQELETALARLKTYRQAVLHHYLNNPDWERVKIGEVASVGTGITPLKSKKQYYEGGTIPWVTSGALNDAFVNQPSDFVTEAAVNQTRLKTYPKGTLLVALYGEGKTRGKSSELNIEATVNQAIAAINLFPEHREIKPFLKLFLQKNYDKIRKLSSGGVQPNLNLSIIKDTVFPLPDLPTQTRIVEEIEERLSEADAMENTIRQELKRAENLRQSILKQAFAGKLVRGEFPALEIADTHEQTSIPINEKIGQLNLF